MDRDIREACEVVAKKCDADETARLAALLNADFGLPRSCSNGCYDQLLARFAVSSGEEARQAAVRIRADRARLARLRMLKDSLYAEPSLFVISRVEAQPDVNIDENLIREAWQLSALLKSAEAWWGPLMAAWSSLASNFKTEEAASVALRVLVDAIHRMDKKMASRYGIPGEAEFDDCGK
ncbi:hypothetical protein ACGFIR_06490 [Micromonospora sp. NPDC049051]|uniref:hypothetical protein n=1 Tax=Micromonospora sp. NPDC049051 TaxID=3364264 RepID=UPI003720F872